VGERERVLYVQKGPRSQKAHVCDHVGERSICFYTWTRILSYIDKGIYKYPKRICIYTLYKFMNYKLPFSLVEGSLWPASFSLFFSLLLLFIFFLKMPPIWLYRYILRGGL